MDALHLLLQLGQKSVSCHSRIAVEYRYAALLDQASYQCAGIRSEYEPH